MTRRKSVCLKWTLILVLIVFCPYVYSRPQEPSQTVVTSSSTLEINKPTEDPIRYRYRDYNVSLNTRKPSLDISFVPDLNYGNITNHSIKITRLSDLLPTKSHNITKNSNLVDQRLSRLIRHRLRNNVKNSSNRKNYNRHRNSTKLPTKRPIIQKEKNKPVIKKVVTKWTDNAKYEDLDFSYESTTSDEIDFIKFPIALNANKHSTESNTQKSEALTDKRIPDKRYRPRPQYSEETEIYTNNFQIVDSYSFPSTRPPYVFNTPTPTPVITNVGYPEPWPQRPQESNYQTVHNRPTTQKPYKITKPTKGPYDYHNTFQNNFPQYPNFEVTTFQPTTAAYTDRIVIRPEEYSASPEDCPTIFLTLNNTFQGQGKEVCPDLNIAVNTNVINKNVVFESEEENDTSFTDVFGIPLGDDLESEETPQDYSNSAENQEEEVSESASIEATGLTNYNAANVAESSEPASFGSPSAAISEFNRPGKPSGNDDDSFGLSSILSFFQPAINAFAWLATINPLSFGLLSLLLSPLVLLIAGTSGVAALFAPWAFSYGREAPKLVHVYRPQWQWDDEYKAWELNSFPNRQWQPNSLRSNENYTSTMRSTVKTTWFYKLVGLMKAATQTLKTTQKRLSMQNNHKIRRKKRETWTIRVK